MGTVYLGERDAGQFEHRSAIKVIKHGMDSSAVLRRFFAERRILARLQHPNITRLFDGGMFANGMMQARVISTISYLRSSGLLRKLFLRNPGGDPFQSSARCWCDWAACKYW